MDTPQDFLLAGARILGLELEPHGFRFALEKIGSGSGGHYAQGAFVRGDRRLELHYRGSLGLVAYSIGSSFLSHDDYARARRASIGPSHYPSVPKHALDDFRALAVDLVELAADFVRGPGDEFRACAVWATSNPRPTGFAALDQPIQ
jgi:hypothetical protein